MWRKRAFGAAHLNTEDRPARRLALGAGVVLLLTSVALAWAFLPLGSSASGGRAWPVDACQPLFASPVDQFPDGLRGGPIGADLVAQFPAINLTCNATESNGVSEVRGVFSELADDAGTVAVVVALGPATTDSEYRAYLGETFPGLKIDFETTDPTARRGLIGWVVGHPKVEEARRRHRESMRNVDLSDLSSDLANGAHR